MNLLRIYSARFACESSGWWGSPCARRAFDEFVTAVEFFHFPSRRDAMYTELKYELDDHVATITLQRPEARNALTFTTYRELEAAIRTSTARCFICPGPAPAFCSGADVKKIMANPSPRPAVTNLAPQLTPAADALLHTDIPIIAAVNGAAIGWGMELSLMADLRV